MEQISGMCGICPAGCAVRVTLAQGKLVAVEPDASRGNRVVCRRGRHAPEIVHSPHRLLRPLRRTGAKGSFDFEPISWDAAYARIAEALQRIKVESGPEAVAIYTGRGTFEQSLCDIYQPAGVAPSSASSVLFPFGSPNTTGVGALCYVSFARIAPHATFGRVLGEYFFDHENAQQLLVWGANPATDSPPTKSLLLEEAARRGVELAVIDPRRTEAARLPGARWVPLRPGTDGALALGMMRVLFEEQLYDRELVDRWCHGAAELREYTRAFSPERVSEITWVPAETIRELARRLARADGASPVMYTGIEYSNCGVQAVRAVLSLFALAGQLDRPGGIVFSMPGSWFPINRSCNVANPCVERAVGIERFPVYSRYRKECHAAALPEAMLHGVPYRVRGLLVHGSSILTSWPQPARWREAFSALDFMVCIDRQLTADAAYADLVLPATTMYENLSYVVHGPTFRVRERILEPLGEARNDSLIMAELARHLGYGERYPQSEEALLRFVLQGSGFTLEQVRAAGGEVRVARQPLVYRKWERGLLRSDGQPGFETPTGKLELASTILAEHGCDPLPAYSEPREGPRAAPALARRYPLVFNSGARLQSDFRSQHHGIAGLLRDNPTPAVELNAQDAAVRGIGDGELVIVRTPRGAVRFRARVTEDIVRGAVECNMGGGTPVGPPAWQQWNVNELTDADNCDPISGFPVYKALLCEVERCDAAPDAGAD